MELYEIQKLIRNFSKEKSLNNDVNIRIIDLASEIGELSKEILKGTNYGGNSFNKTKNFDSELGDVLFSLICIANITNTDLEDSLKGVLNKYEQRFRENKEIGSLE